MERTKAIVYGVGRMGKLMTRLMVGKGVLIVCAIGHVSNIGKDLGEVVELNYPLNVRISDDGDAVLREQNADIVVLAIASEIGKMYPHIKKCVEKNFNVITTAEEALFPWLTSP